MTDESEPGGVRPSLHAFCLSSVYLTEGDVTMATTINKQRVAQPALLHAPAGGRGREAAPLPVLEQFVYALCREDATREQARPGLTRTCDERFFDWNEVRVSSVRELEEALAGLPDAESRAQRLIVVPAGGVRDDLLVRPGGAAQEGAEAGGQAADALPGRQRLRRRLGGAAVARRPRHPARRRRRCACAAARAGRAATSEDLEAPRPAWSTWSQGEGPQFTDASATWPRS